MARCCDNFHGNLLSRHSIVWERSPTTTKETAEKLRLSTLFVCLSISRRYRETMFSLGWVVIYPAACLFSTSLIRKIFVIYGASSEPRVKRISQIKKKKKKSQISSQCQMYCTLASNHFDTIFSCSTKRSVGVPLSFGQPSSIEKKRSHRTVEFSMNFDDLPVARWKFANKGTIAQYPVFPFVFADEYFPFTDWPCTSECE